MVVYLHMDITWYGQGCFHLRVKRPDRGSVSVVIDPYSEDVGLKPPSVTADMVLVSHDHFDHNNVDAVKGDPFVIREPGEYEIDSVFVEGIHGWHDNSSGEERGAVTMFTMYAEGLHVCHLADLGQEELTDEQVERIGTVDVLLVPVGGTYTIDGAQARHIVQQIGPGIVVPMHYHVKGLEVDIAEAGNFLEAMGISGKEAEEKLKVSKNDIPGDEEAMEVVVLEAQGVQ